MDFSPHQLLLEHGGVQAEPAPLQVSAIDAAINVSAIFQIPRVHFSERKIDTV